MFDVKDFDKIFVSLPPLELLPISPLFATSINDCKMVVELVGFVILSIKVSGPAILLKLWIKHQ